MGNPRVLRQLPRGLKRRAARPIDRAGLERAVKAFLEATGLDLSDPSLAQTPQRVAAAWADELIDGYARVPSEVLGKTYPVPKGSAGEMVVITGLRFHSICPHHLLPYEGRAHLAYVPSKRVVGFGRLASLLECFAHRLILQEELARAVAHSMATLLESPATACILEAQQACLRLRGSMQRDACTHAEAYEGTLQTDRGLRAELWARLGSSA